MSINVLFIPIVLALGVTGLLSLYQLHKLRAIHLLLYQVKDQHHGDIAGLYQQFEALLSLNTELALTKSLPGTRGWAASPDFLLELVRHARGHRPCSVVECSSGTSTLVLARCMQMNGKGKVYSLEHDPHFAARTRWQLRAHGLSDWAEVLDAPLTPQHLAGELWPWYSTVGLPQTIAIDMLVIDGPPQSTRPLARYPAGPVLFERMAQDGHVFLDDAKRADEQAMLQRWQREFPAWRQSSRPCEKGCAVLYAGTPPES